MKRTVLSVSLIVCAALALLTAMAGCGGVVDFAVWQGSYSGSGDLDDGKNGTLSLVCDENGLVSGTLVVTDLADGEEEPVFPFTPGNYDLVGSITSTGGNFEVSGTVPDVGDFFIRGNFPTDGSAKEYTVVTEATEEYPEVQSYEGTLTRE